MLLHGQFAQTLARFAHPCGKGLRVEPPRFLRIGLHAARFPSIQNVRIVSFGESKHRGRVAAIGGSLEKEASSRDIAASDEIAGFIGEEPRLLRLAISRWRRRRCRRWRLGLRRWRGWRGRAFHFPSPARQA